MNYTRWNQINGDFLAELLISKIIEQSEKNPNVWISYKFAVLACHYLGKDDSKEIANLLSCKVHTIKRWLKFWKSLIKKHPRDGWTEFSRNGKVIWKKRCPCMIEEMVNGLKLLRVTLSDVNNELSSLKMRSLYVHF